MLTTQQYSGAIAELQAMQYYLSNGYEIFTPLLPSSRADFVATKDGVCKRIQVKKATWSSSGSYKYLQARLHDRTERKKMYEDGDFDEIVFLSDEGDIWIADWPSVKGLTSVCLAGTKDGYTATSSLYNPEDWRIH